ncbi:MAG TPA: hypothetical protein VNZ26_01345 [Vicinamibacterales bacterium]|jgi:CheY-like chemotaxis protein|nr:hypothetical protein [Vicinamibacterales bacterium]
MPMQTVALVNGHPDMLPWLDHLLEGSNYEVVFSTLGTEAYADIKRLRPQRVVLCTTLEHPDALHLLTMLRLDPATRGTAVLTVTPFGPHEFGGLNAGPASASDPEAEWAQSGIGPMDRRGIGRL